MSHPSETLKRSDGWSLNLHHFPEFGAWEWDKKVAAEVWVPNHPWQWYLHDPKDRVRDAGRAETKPEAIEAGGAIYRALTGQIAEKRMEVHQVRDAAIRMVEAGASPTWLIKAESIVRRLAQSSREFTADEVWDELTIPEEPRALGAVMQRLSREGLIKKTGRYVESLRKENHSRPVCVWVGTYEQCA